MQLLGRHLVRRGRRNVSSLSSLLLLLCPDVQSKVTRARPLLPHNPARDLGSMRGLEKLQLASPANITLDAQPQRIG